MERFHRRWLLAAAWLCGCASAPHYSAPQVGQSLRAVAAAQSREANRPVHLFAADRHRFALYGVDVDGGLDDSGASTVSLLVFEDDRYLGKLATDAALAYSACLAQPNGTLVLAERLRALTAGETDPLARPTSVPERTVGDELCPPGPAATQQRTPTVATAAEPDDFGTVVGGVFVGTAFVIVSLASTPVVVPLAVALAANDQSSLKAQESITLTMEGAAVTQLMGQPTATLQFEPAHTTVWYYERWLGGRALWVGLDSDRVSWLRFGRPDPWLRAVTDRPREGG